MPIHIYDSLSRTQRELEPRDPGKISMYACGLTVYNDAHIGNVRTLLWYDQIRRYLEYRGFDVTYVMNYTDVDDKIIERARVEGLTPDEVAEKYARSFEEDMAALNVEPPTLLVRATEHIDEMIVAIQGLIDKGVAYEAEGDVYFAVEKFPGYGKLSKRTLDDMRAGERIEPSEKKQHPLDFALWKTAKEGEPSWRSPWGPGRPGWHIECSVMSTKHLGMAFDIHGGATDLIFPHHENEIAQAEALDETGAPFARNWLHAGLVQLETEKMSKSLGNVVLVKELLKSYDGEVVRYWALSASYRTQATFSEAALEDARQAYERVKNFHEAAKHALGEPLETGAGLRRAIGREPSDNVGELVAPFIAAMDDDFNSAGGLAALHELVRHGNKLIDVVQRGDEAARMELRDAAAAVLEICSVLRLRLSRGPAGSELVGRLVDYLLELREDARNERAFDRADAIRVRLQELGVTIEDTPTGPRWRV